MVPTSPRVPRPTPTAESLARIWRGSTRAGRCSRSNPVTGLLGLPRCPRSPRPRVRGLRRLISRYVECEELRGDAGPAARGRRGRGDRPRSFVFRAAGYSMRSLPAPPIPGVLEPVLMGGPRPYGRRRGQQHADLPRGRTRSGARSTCYPRAMPAHSMSRRAERSRMALHAISLLTHRRLIDDIERHRADAQLIVMPPPCPLNIQPIDFAHAGELDRRRAAGRLASSSTVAARRASQSVCACTGIRACPTGIRVLSRRSRRSRRRSRRRRCGRAGSRSACRARSYAAGSPGARAAGCCSRR